MKLATVVALSGLSALANAQASLWAQCGGNGYSGPTNCVSGACCVFSNEWYSQCVPCTGNPPPSNPPPSNPPPSNPPPSNPPPGNPPPSPPSGGGVTTTLPQSAGATSTSAAIRVTGSYDGGMRRFERNPRVCDEQSETGEEDAMFILESGATLSNVIIGASSAEGVHCRGTCTLNNVWWTDVCEDAATFKQTSGTSYVNGGGAFNAADKIFQFNGRGTVSVRNFYARDYGKIVRNCGNCSNNGGPRHVIIDGVVAVDGGTLCGINTNYGDTCRVTNACQDDGKWCELYRGVSGGGSSPKLSSEPDGVSCTASNTRTNC